MSLVFVKISIPLIETLPDFFTKLKEFTGGFRIEQQACDEMFQGIMTISFYTDKIDLKEGETRQVDLIAFFDGEDVSVDINGRITTKKIWNFKEIKSVAHI